MPGRRLLYLIASAVLGAAAACDSFAGGDSPPAPVTPEAGGIDDASNAADSSVNDADQPDHLAPPPDDLLDAAVRPDASAVQADGLYLTCPPTSTGSKFLTPTTTTVVKRKTGYDFPFGIVTDSLFVYWVSQFTDQLDASTGPYNGAGKARIHRVSKTAVNADPAETILVDGEAEHTVALALDGPYIYWTSLMNGATKAQIRRIRRDCVAPCAPTTYLETPTTRPISHMRRGQPGLIFAMTDQGNVFSIDTVNNLIAPLSSTSHSNPSLAAMGESAFVSWLDEPKVLKLGAGSVAEHGEFPPVDGGDIGSNQIATDCTRLFAWRKQDGDLWFSSATQPSSFEKYAVAQQSDVYNTFADNDYVYVGSSDGVGLRVISIATHQLVKKFDGSYFRVWADNTGLYAGDHSKDAPGAIYKFSD
jgi:hypothetical protein